MSYFDDNEESFYGWDKEPEKLKKKVNLEHGKDFKKLLKFLKKEDIKVNKYTNVSGVSDSTTII